MSGYVERTCGPCGCASHVITDDAKEGIKVQCLITKEIRYAFAPCNVKNDGPGVAKAMTKQWAGPA